MIFIKEQTCYFVYLVYFTLKCLTKFKFIKTKKGRTWKLSFLAFFIVFDT